MSYMCLSNLLNYTLKKVNSTVCKFTSINLTFNKRTVCHPWGCEAQQRRKVKPQSSRLITPLSPPGTHLTLSTGGKSDSPQIASFFFKVKTERRAKFSFSVNTVRIFIDISAELVE